MWNMLYIIKFLEQVRYECDDILEGTKFLIPYLQLFSRVMYIEVEELRGHRKKA